MKNIKMLGLAAVAAMALIALVGVSAASATTVRSGSSTGSAYNGTVSGSLTPGHNSTLVTSFGTVTCTSSTLSGVVKSDGTTTHPPGATDTQLTGASWSGCTLGSTNCTVTVNNLSAGNPWASVVSFDSGHTGNRDGTLQTFMHDSSGLETDGSVNVACGSFLNCTYAGAGTNKSVTTNLYNPDNPNRPDTGSGHAQAQAASVSLAKVGGTFCPASSAWNGLYDVTGSGGVNLWTTA